MCLDDYTVLPYCLVRVDKYKTLTYNVYHNKGDCTMMSDVQKRMRIVETYKKLESLRGTAEKVDANVKTVKKWVDRFAKYGKKGLVDKRFKMPAKSKGKSR